MNRVLEVPLLEPDSFLTIDVGADLADDPAEMCQLLADERCAPKWWLLIAAAYATRGKYAPAAQVLSSGLSSCHALERPEDKADFYMLQGWIELAELRRAPASEKPALFDRATESSNRAFRLYNDAGSEQSLPAVLLQGALQLAVGNVNDALPLFQTVLAQQPENGYAKLGRARVLYARRNYKGALRLYQEVLKQAPTEPAAVVARIGLGVCFWRLRDAEKAEKAWRRALALSPAGSVNAGVAHALLGVAELTDALHGQKPAFASHYTAAMEHFQDAYRAGVYALPALKLASYVFSKHDMAMVNKLTNKAVEHAARTELLGEAMFWKARAAHYVEDLDAALGLYTQASAANAQNLAASIGKGIIELRQDRVAEALLTLELVVQRNPKNPHALLYAGLFGAKIDPTKARGLLESYVQHARQGEPLCYEALLTLSQLYEKVDAKRALGYLRQAQALKPETPTNVRINLGALEFAVGNFAEAERNFAEAARDNADDVLLQFNLARAREALAVAEKQSLDSVIEEYRRIPVQEALARLSLIEARSDPKRAEACVRVAERLLEQNRGDLELRALYAYHLRNAQQQNGKAAAELGRREQDLHKQTLTEFEKHDPYALVSLGNVYLRVAALTGRSDPARQARSFVRASELFEKVLKLDPNNAYAAQGVAIGLVYTRNAKVAQSIFSRLRETLLRDDLQTTVNFAHCLMDAGDFARASELYLFAYHANPTTELATLLGWSWLARGARARDARALGTALEWANTAANSSGSENNYALKFNVALVAMQLGDTLKRLPAEQRTLELLESAAAGVEQALKLFQELQGIKSELKFDPGDLEEKADHAEHNVLPHLQSAIEEQREHERKALERREQAVKQREEELRILQAAKEREERERKEREEELAKERERLQREAMEWEAQRQAKREAESQRGAAASDSDEEGTKRKRKRGKRKQSKRSDHSESEPEHSEHSESEPEADYSDHSDGENAKPETDEPAEPENAEPENAETGEPEAEAASEAPRAKKVMDDDSDDE